MMMIIHDFISTAAAMMLTSSLQKYPSPHYLFLVVYNHSMNDASHQRRHDIPPKSKIIFLQQRTVQATAEN